jgi:hypothetical protein
MSYELEISSVRSKYKKKGKKRKGRQRSLAMIAPLLLMGCATTELSGEATLRSHYVELWNARPTYSEEDTDETLRSGAVFYDVFVSLCPEDVCVVDDPDGG